MKFFKLLYNGFLWGLIGGILASQSLWLEMRINTGLIIPAVILGAFAAALIFKNKFNPGFKFSLINLAICFILAFAILGKKKLMVLPASIIREGIKITSISFSTVNLAVFLFIAAGLTIIGLENIRQR